MWTRNRTRVLPIGHNFPGRASLGRSGSARVTVEPAKAGKGVWPCERRAASDFFFQSGAARIGLLEALPGELWFGWPGGQLAKACVPASPPFPWITCSVKSALAWHRSILSGQTTLQWKSEPRGHVCNEQTRVSRVNLRPNPPLTPDKFGWRSIGAVRGSRPAR